MNISDTKSNYSGISGFSDVSIDPVMRTKAERILENHPKNGLEVIKEDASGAINKLTLDKLKTLDD